MSKAVYAGSFDPITLGHQDIINRALKIVDKLVIVVMNNSKKKYWFNLKERERMIKEIFKGQNNVEIKSFDGALVSFMKQEKIKVLFKGLRNVKDFEDEMIYAHANYYFSNNDVETVFLPASTNYAYVSSSFVKEVAIFNLELEKFVDKAILEEVKKRAKDYR